jgi:hypothetical protein
MRHRNLQLLGERLQFFGGLRILQALSDQDHRPLGAEQHVDRLHDAVRIGAAARRDVRAPRLRVRRLFRGGLLEHIERHVEHDRAGPAGDHGLPGLPHHHRHLLAASRLIDPFADAADRGGEIGLIVAMQLLECATAELAGRHVAGDGEERHRIEIGGGERDRQVHRAGAARREGRDRLALHAVVDVRHEAADRLVVRRDGLDLALPLEQRVDELDVAVAAQAEGVGDLLLDQVVDDDLRAIEHIVLGHGFSCVWSGVIAGPVPAIPIIRAQPCLHKRDGVRNSGLPELRAFEGPSRVNATWAYKPGHDGDQRGGQNVSRTRYTATGTAWGCGGSGRAAMTRTRQLTSTLIITRTMLITGSSTIISGTASS